LSTIRPQSRKWEDSGPPAAPHNARPSLLKRVFRPAYRTLKGWLPENRFGDRLFAFIKFVRFQRRLPSGAAMYNDVFYGIKTSPEILDPLRVFVTDKEFVKLYVKAVVGDEYNVPTIDVIRTIEAVDTYEFPVSCCIKPTHASGRVVFRRNGEPVDRQKIKSWFHTNYYLVNREANYKPLRPKVIIEPLIFNSSNVEDFKIFCFKGAPKIIQVDVDRHTEHKRQYFDVDWNELGFSVKYPRSDKTLARPGNLAEMLSVAAELSKRFWLVRVDLYSDGAKVLVGELTHCADDADGRFMPAAAEAAVSDHIFRDVPIARGK
jgi:TupA-like ATPgrasp